MRVYVVPNQVPRYSGFGAFNGESAESHCARVYADCPELMAKCLSQPWNPAKPYTIIGKKMRGLPSSYSPGQCPGAAQAPAPAPQPVQQPYNPPPQQAPYAPLPSGGVGPITAGGPFVPPASGGYVDQLLANKPLLIGGVAVLGFFAWRMTQRPGRGAMNGYGKRKSTRN